jgi:hypothetical protein
MMSIRNKWQNVKQTTNQKSGQRMLNRVFVEQAIPLASIQLSPNRRLPKQSRQEAAGLLHDHSLI